MGVEGWQPLFSWLSSHFHTGHAGGCLRLALLDPSSRTTAGDPWVLQSRAKLAVMLEVCDFTVLLPGTLV